MPCQPNVRWTIAPAERPLLIPVARALEQAIDGLPTRSPWRAECDRLHERLTESLAPELW